MGRLQTWIDRVGRSRRGSRRTDGRLARRRPLGFERCESRLALSAASPAEDLIVESDDFAQILTEWWGRTPGAAEWAQFSFGAMRHAFTLHGEQSVDFTINRITFPTLRDNVAEGGLITFAEFGEGALRDMIVNRQSNAVVDAAFGRFNGSLQLTDATATLAGADLGPITQGLAISPGHVDSAPTWDFASTDVPDLLGETEASHPSAMVEGGAISHTPPILRITAPLDPARNEGGRIDLTAMAGPTSLDRQSSLAAVASQAATPRVAARAADDLPAAASSQSLRARAVVYEVAYERDAERSSAPQEIGATLDDDARRGPEEESASPVRDAVPLARHADDAPAVEPTAANPLQVGQDRGALSTPAGPQASDSAQRNAARERDAALAAWGDDRDGDSTLYDDAEAGVALTDARERNVGLAIALAATAAPLARRYRRSKQAHAAERNAGLL